MCIIVIYIAKKEKAIKSCGNRNQGRGYRTFPYGDGRISGPPGVKTIWIGLTELYILPAYREYFT
jgi:hypothetical protein